MKKIVSIMIALILSISMFAAASADEAPVVVTMAVGSQFTTLDPALNTETVNGYALSHMYIAMFDPDEDNVAQPDACESYTVSEDGLTYTFTLKKGLLWSDGTELTTKDFVYSYLRLLSFGPENAWAVNNMLTYVEGAAAYNAKALDAGKAWDCTVEDASYVGITAIDDYTLEIKLCKPCAYLPNLMCGSAWSPVYCTTPQHESLWAFEPGYPVTGAFTLTECNEGEKVVMVKNPLYYNADSITVDEIDLLVVTDGTAQAQAFQAGEIDVALTISPETASKYAGTENLWLITSPSIYYLAINSSEDYGPEWAQNVNVRKALNYAIDREALVDILGGAEFYPPLYGFIPHGLAGVNGDFRVEGDAKGIPYTYDPDKAIELLAGEGYDASNPLTIKYKYSNNGIHGDVATVLQAMWNAVGVNVEMVCVESGVFYDQLDAADYEIARYGYVANDDVMQYLEIWTVSMQVVASVVDEKYDAMCDAACYITDPAEYYTALHEIEDYYYGEMCYDIPLFDYTTPALVASGMNGYAYKGSVWLGNVTFD